MGLRQDLTTDTVDRYIEAPPAKLYELIADVTRTPEYSPDVVKVEWLDGATGPAVGARFKATNKQVRGPAWNNKPVITVLEPGQEIAWERTEPGGGTVEWRYRFEPEGTGTRITESYKVIKPLNMLGWFIIGGLYRLKDRKTDLRNSMLRTLDRLAEMTEPAAESAAS